jgi:hypothetical protein
MCYKLLKFSYNLNIKDIEYAYLNDEIKDMLLKTEILNSSYEDFYNFYKYINKKSMNDIDFYKVMYNDFYMFNNKICEIPKYIDFYKLYNIFVQNNNNNNIIMFFKLLNEGFDLLKLMIKDLWLDDDTKNFSIICKNNEVIKIHKFILMIRCKLYRGMFKCTKDGITLNKIYDYSLKCSKSLKLFYKYLYFDDFLMEDLKTLNKEEYEDLIDCNDYFGLNINSFYEYDLNLKYYKIHNK